MKATIFTPNNAPQVLTAIEVGLLNPTRKTAPMRADMPTAGLMFGQLAEALVCGNDYLVLAAENAADYANPCPSAVAELERLTGLDWGGENQPYGPILIIEA